MAIDFGADFAIWGHVEGYTRLELDRLVFKIGGGHVRTYVTKKTKYIIYGKSNYLSSMYPRNGSPIECKFSRKVLGGAMIPKDYKIPGAKFIKELKQKSSIKNQKSMEKARYHVPAISRRLMLG